MNFYNLPHEILTEIAKYLPFSSVANWAYTSREQYSGDRSGDQSGDQYSQRPACNSEPRFRSLILAWAASRGAVDTIRTLISIVGNGPWMNEPVLGYGRSYGLRIPGSYGMTAMHQAAKYGHTDIIEILVGYGADVNTIAARDLLPIHLAQNADVVETLVRHGSFVNGLESHSTPALMSMVLWWKRPLVQDSIIRSAVGSLQLLNLNIPHCADVNAGGGVHPTALHHAVKYGKGFFVKELIERQGAEVNKECGKYNTALGAAITAGWPDIASCLITLPDAQRADPSLPTGDFANAFGTHFVHS
ncbi:hypothetical protein G7Z17_g8023 [Cylindrodendrum hubeiense]|uniref:Uncharacterized protein n=1 Tax=Cylindrodendrum hubeiense TaxID=595255 RepID=A0A9P5H9E3_9HYPO|nr:hypothetical protein G7Z17_g8023 [Cylindrodendrum hubeiense]